MPKILIILLASVSFIVIGTPVNHAEAELLLHLDGSVTGPIPAFPGAAGAGRLSRGGRGGDVYHVTNLNCSGPGTLREGIATADGPRTIVFDIGGTIHLTEPLFIDKSFLTIAGQTAPGDGITIRTDHGNRGLYFLWDFLDNGAPERFPNDVIIQHVRIGHHTEPLDPEFKVSPDTPALDPQYENAPFRRVGNEAIRIDNTENIMIDHVSVRYGARNNLNMADPVNNTLQYVFNMESTGRKFGGWIGGEGDEHSASQYHNLITHHYGRPFRAGGGRYEQINNVVYNVATRGSGKGYSNISQPNTIINLIGNIFIDGPGTGEPPVQIPEGTWPVDHNPPVLPPEFAFDSQDAVNAFISGNYWDRSYDYDRQPGCQSPLTLESADSYINPAAKDNFNLANSTIDLMPLSRRITPTSARQAYINVLSWGGSSASRDIHDHRVVRNVMNKDGSWVNLPKDVPGGAFPALQSAEPVVSTARDGIPDWWKQKQGLDPEKQYHQRYAADGYTYLEKYLHWCTRNTFPPNPQETEIVEVAVSQSRGAAATVCWPDEQKDELLVGSIDGVEHYLLLRFDLEEIAMGRVLDAFLKLVMVDGGGRFTVYGLDHDRAGQMWDPSQPDIASVPGLELVDGNISLIRDDLIVLGEIETTDINSGDTIVMNNPNLPVYLNLAGYYTDQPQHDVVTVLIVSDDGWAEFSSGNSGHEAPALTLDAIKSPL